MAAARGGVAAAVISAPFHATLARAIAAACLSVRTSERIGTVCLSGGSFQNMRLLERTIAELEHAGFAVYWQSEVPPNDGGLSLGQARIANARIERGER